MDLLRWLATLRSPVLDRAMLTITELGAEYAVAAVALWFLWCGDKRKGFRLLSLFFVIMTASETLKGLLRAPRPWTRDPTFYPVSAARTGAGGYSCPSGHAATAGGVYAFAGGGIRRRPVRALPWIAVGLTMFSRLYLGVHTLPDVLAGLALGLACTAGLAVLFRLCDRGRLREGWIYTGLCVLAAVTVAATRLGFDSEEGLRNAPKMLGSACGLLFAYWLNAAHTRFSTDGTRLQQTVKYVGGLAVSAGLLFGLKALFIRWAPGFWPADALRYGIVTAAAMGVWPLCFPLIRRLGKKSPSPAATLPKPVDKPTEQPL